MLTSAIPVFLILKVLNNWGELLTTIGNGIIGG